MYKPRPVPFLLLFVEKYGSKIFPRIDSSTPFALSFILSTRLFSSCDKEIFINLFAILFYNVNSAIFIIETYTNIF